MKRESFIFYKSFYDSIKELAPEEQAQIYNAIFEYEFNANKIKLKGVCKSIFTLIIPQLEANNKRYLNGKLGGRPKIYNQNETKTKPNNNLNITKMKPKDNQTITKTKPNDNVNVNVNENDNVNVYDIVEENFGRTLSPIEYEEISKWENTELTRYAIKQAILNGKYNIKYISRILENYKKNNIQTIKQAQEEEKKFKNKNNKEITTEWLDQNIKVKTPSEEDRKEIENMLKEFK